MAVSYTHLDVYKRQQQYLEKGPQLGQREAIRAIRTLGNALEHMTRGSDQRIELELALFTLRCV